MRCSAYDIGEINITLIKLKEGGQSKEGEKGVEGIMGGTDG